MIHRTHHSAGFTAVELLVTLFVAAAFLIAGYQLFNVVIKDGGDTRAQSAAANVAYNYIRQYSDSATNPCAPSSPLTNQSISVNSLTNVTVTVTIQCTQSDASSVSRVEAVVNYNNPQQSVRYATYVDKSKGASPVTDVTDGLVGWWKMNGNANSDAGGGSGTVYGAVPTTGQNGQANTGYSFDGAGDYISLPSGFSDFTNGITISVWAKPTAASNFARFIDFGTGQGANNILFYRSGTTSNLVYATEDASGTILGTLTASSAITLNQWKLYTVTVTTGGAATIYVNGSSVATASGVGAPTQVTRTSNYIGRSNWSSDSYYTGSMDDLRIYNRALSGSEVLQLYTQGAE